MLPLCPHLSVSVCVCVCVCVPVVRVVSLRSTPPDIGIISVLLGAVGVTLGLGGTAHKLHASEAVDAARKQHAVVMEVHGAVAAGLHRHRINLLLALISLSLHFHRKHQDLLVPGTKRLVVVCVCIFCVLRRRMQQRLTTALMNAFFL